MSALDGVYARLDRTYENIGNLEREIAGFLKDGNHAAVEDNNARVSDEAIEFLAGRVVPARFSVLSGEVIHHLRCCLDHVAWELSSPDARAKAASAKEIGFPILAVKPADESELKQYERKIKWISSVGRNIIESLQPYRREEAVLTGPLNDPLWIIHDMDRINKHRELVIVLNSFDMRATRWSELNIMLQRYAHISEESIAKQQRAFDPNLEISAQVSFQDFGGRKIYPVIPGLSKLADYVHRVVDIFSSECF